MRQRIRLLSATVQAGIFAVTLPYYKSLSMVVAIVFPSHFNSRIGIVFACLNFPVDYIFCSRNGRPRPWNNRGSIEGWGAGMGAQPKVVAGGWAGRGHSRCGCERGPESTVVT